MATVFGLDIRDIPNEWTALEATTVVRCLDQ